MIPIFSRKIFPKDAESFGSAIQDLTNHLRIGLISSPDPQTYTANIRWLDHPGFRKGVVLTQGSYKEWHIPKEGAPVLCYVDNKDQVWILRYLNDNIQALQESSMIPQLNPGEKCFECEGSFIIMRANGNIELLSDSFARVLLDNVNQAFQVDGIRLFKYFTAASSLVSGVAKRLMASLTGGNIALQPVTDLTGQSTYAEHVLKVYEKENDSNPIVTITMGNVIDKDGFLTDYQGGTKSVLGNSSKAVALQISMRNGVNISIDKEGVVTFTGAKAINFLNAAVDISDADEILGLQSKMTDGSLKGQHAAREHDAVDIPLGMSYTDPNHAGLATKANQNVSALQSVAAAFMTPMGPCTLIPTNLAPPTSLKLQGEIVDGSAGVYIGDKAAS